jgi:hypothetical protein
MNWRCFVLAIVSVMVVQTPGLSADGVLTNAQIESRPNVVLISVDDLNNWGGYLKGHPQARTPNIDRLTRRETLSHDSVRVRRRRSDVERRTATG